MRCKLDLKTQILANKFKDCSYFKNLHEYIVEKIENDGLKYEDLKYLYNNLYKNCSDFIKQNIYPVCEFILQGYSYKECEEIADTLEDASSAVFFYDKKDTGKLYNKYFSELRFSYLAYNSYIIQGDPKDIAFEKMLYENIITRPFQKDIEGYIVEGRYLYYSEIDRYLKDIEGRKKELSEEFKNLIENNTKVENKIKIPKYLYSNIIVANNIVEGIDAQNLPYKGSAVNRPLEKYPYNSEEMKIIDSYSRLEKTSHVLENFIENNYSKEFEDLEL